MFKELFAVCLLISDFDKSLNFYRDTLRLELNTQNGKFADFKLNGTSLAIFEQSEATTMFPKKFMHAGGGCVLAYQVPNVKETCEELQTKGVEIIEGPKLTPWGQKVAYFQDPDQNIWEISEK